MDIKSELEKVSFCLPPVVCKLALKVELFMKYHKPPSFAHHVRQLLLIQFGVKKVEWHSEVKVVKASKTKIFDDCRGRFNVIMYHSIN